MRQLLTSLVFLSFAAGPLQADTDSDARALMLIRIALENTKAQPSIDSLPDIDFKIDPARLQPKADPVAAWKLLPLNVGSCPCKSTGGCHCQPHSECAKGTCAQHNPLLKKAEPAAPVLQGVFCPT